MSITDRIKSAESVEEVSKLQSELSSYKYASNKTRNRAQKAANRRIAYIKAR